MKKNVQNKIGRYGVDQGMRGVYDSRNPLNDLTGREWTHFTNSILETNYSLKKEDVELLDYLRDSLIPTKFTTGGADGHAHHIRKQHPSPKPPRLMGDLIKFFTKKDQWILDPFMGVGGTLLGASLEKRNAVGVDLSKDYVSIYKDANKHLGLKEQVALAGDARELGSLKHVKTRIFDAIITDPPYANMMSKKRTGGDKTKKVGDSTPYTSNEKDIGNIDYFAFLDEIRKIFGSALTHLKNKGYLIVFIKDLQPTKEHHNLLHADLVSELVKIPSLSYKGYKIWYDKTLNLYPYGYPFSFVANQLHQFILVFRKEELG